VEREAHEADLQRENEAKMEKRNEKKRKEMTTSQQLRTKLPKNKENKKLIMNEISILKRKDIRAWQRGCCLR
jgi:hypothetical protein